MYTEKFYDKSYDCVPRNTGNKCDFRNVKKNYLKGYIVCLNTKFSGVK